MSYLLETFRSFLPPVSLVVETQQGQGASNLVYSSSVSMVEAIQTAHRLKVEKDSMIATMHSDKARHFLCFS
jgi:hypothetical protein